MEDKFLEDLKKEYLKTKMPVYLKQDGWHDLKSKLGQNNHSWFELVFPESLVFSLAILIVIATFIGIKAQTAQASSPLYEIKVLTSKATDFIQNLPKSLDKPTTPLPAKPSPKPALQPTSTFVINSPLPSPTQKSSQKPVNTFQEVKGESKNVQQTKNPESNKPVQVNTQPENSNGNSSEHTNNSNKNTEKSLGKSNNGNSNKNK